MIGKTDAWRFCPLLCAHILGVINPPEGLTLILPSTLTRMYSLRSKNGQDQNQKRVPHVGAHWWRTNIKVTYPLLDLTHYYYFMSNSNLFAAVMYHNAP